MTFTTPSTAGRGKACSSGVSRGNRILRAFSAFMIDLHSHILPGLDDGSRTVEDARALARRAAEDGVTAIAATPHVRSDYPTGPEEMERGVSRLREDFLEQGIDVEVLPGGEIDLGMLASLDDDGLRRFIARASGRYLLLEFPYSGWPAGPRGDGLRARATRLPGRAGPPGAEPRGAGRTRGASRRRCGMGALVQLTAASLDGRIGRSSQAAAERLLGQRPRPRARERRPHARHQGGGPRGRGRGGRATTAWRASSRPRPRARSSRARPCPTRPGSAPAPVLHPLLKSEAPGCRTGNGRTRAPDPEEAECRKPRPERRASTASTSATSTPCARTRGGGAGPGRRDRRGDVPRRLAAAGRGARGRPSVAARRRPERPRQPPPLRPTAGRARRAARARGGPGRRRPGGHRRRARRAPLRAGDSLGGGPRGPAPDRLGRPRSRRDRPRARLLARQRRRPALPGAPQAGGRPGPGRRLPPTSPEVSSMPAPDDLELLRRLDPAGELRPHGRARERLRQEILADPRPDPCAAGAQARAGASCWSRPCWRCCSPRGWGVCSVPRLAETVRSDDEDVTGTIPLPPGAAWKSSISRTASTASGRG